MEASLLVAKMEESVMLWLRYEQGIVMKGDVFEKIKHTLNLIYYKQLLLRSKIRYNKFDILNRNKKLP